MFKRLIVLALLCKLIEGKNLHSDYDTTKDINKRSDGLKKVNDLIKMDLDSPSDICIKIINEKVDEGKTLVQLDNESPIHVSTKPESFGNEDLKSITINITKPKSFGNDGLKPTIDISSELSGSGDHGVDSSLVNGGDGSNGNVQDQVIEKEGRILLQVNDGSTMDGLQKFEAFKDKVLKPVNYLNSHDAPSDCDSFQGNHNEQINQDDWDDFQVNQDDQINQGKSDDFQVNHDDRINQGKYEGGMYFQINDRSPITYLPPNAVSDQELKSSYNSTHGDFSDHRDNNFHTNHGDQRNDIEANLDDIIDRIGIMYSKMNHESPINNLSPRPEFSDQAFNASDISNDIDIGIYLNNEDRYNRSDQSDYHSIDVPRIINSNFDHRFSLNNNEKSNNELKITNTHGGNNINYGNHGSHNDLGNHGDHSFEHLRNHKNFNNNNYDPHNHGDNNYNNHMNHGNIGDQHNDLENPGDIYRKHEDYENQHIQQHIHDNNYGVGENNRRNDNSYQKNYCNHTDYENLANQHVNDHVIVSTTNHGDYGNSHNIQQENYDAHGNSYDGKTKNNPEDYRNHYNDQRNEYDRTNHVDYGNHQNVLGNAGDKGRINLNPEDHGKIQKNNDDPGDNIGRNSHGNNEEYQIHQGNFENQGKNVNPFVMGENGNDNDKIRNNESQFNSGKKQTNFENYKKHQSLQKTFENQEDNFDQSDAVKKLESYNRHKMLIDAIRSRFRSTTNSLMGETERITSAYDDQTGPGFSPTMPSHHICQDDPPQAHCIKEEEKYFCKIGKSSYTIFTGSHSISSQVVEDYVRSMFMKYGEGDRCLDMSFGQGRHGPCPNGKMAEVDGSLESASSKSPSAFKRRMLNIICTPLQPPPKGVNCDEPAHEIYYECKWRTPDKIVDC